MRKVQKLDIGELTDILNLKYAIVRQVQLQHWIEQVLVNFYGIDDCDGLSEEAQLVALDGLPGVVMGKQLLLNRLFKHLL